MQTVEHPSAELVWNRVKSLVRIAKPATNKPDFELFCLAVSAINGCEVCIRSREAAVIEGGLTEDHVHDSVRIAGVA